MNWNRELPMSAFGEESKESWIRNEQGDIIKYELDVKLGKKTDLLKLKKNIVSSLKEKQEYYTLFLMIFQTHVRLLLIVLSN